MTTTPTLADVVAALERRYPLRTAESWDAVGLVAGDPAQPVRRVLFAVDPVAAVADEAVAWGADLLVTHHPLFLRAVHGAGREVHVWTINDPEEMQELLELGVDGIITDRCDMLKTVVQGMDKDGPRRKIP